MSKFLPTFLRLFCVVLFTAAIGMEAASIRKSEKTEKAEPQEALRFNKTAYDRAVLLIQQGHVIRDDKPWTDTTPSTEQANLFIGKHGWSEYAKWYLGINESLRETTKHRYKFPVGDFSNVYRSAVVAAKTRAAQYHYAEIRQAASELLDLIDAQKGAPSSPKEEATPKKEASPKKASSKK